MASLSLIQNRFFSKLLLTLKMIKVQHSIFALPFALTSVLIASNGNLQLLDLVMIVLAMVTARNAAMTFNRIVDLKIDKKNPRTANRELPSGMLSKKFATIFCLVNIILFIAISYYFNQLTFILSPVALMIVLGYSLTKRFTYYTQFFLGLALGISPLAAWIAITGQLSFFAVLLGVNLFFWVAGFDLIYSTLDYAYDKKNGLKNLVVKWGLKKSLILARLFHFISFLSLVIAGIIQNLGLYYFIGCSIIGALLYYEHRLVKPDDLSKVNMAFFTLNGYISLLFLIFVVIDFYI
ncbi:hypothetical protein BVY03_04080 [bacterium K02(2017)]|nr:hypothetical protein BVY03_04080 [bacterium K02(2017)]